MQSVEIKTTDACGQRFTKVLVGGVELKNVKGVDFFHHVGELPEFTITTCGFPKIKDNNAIVKFHFDVETLGSAYSVIRHQLMYDMDSYNNLKDIIKGALVEVPAESGFEVVATKILDRMIGEKE